MKKISRRNFLLASGAVTIGAALAASGGSSSTSTASSLLSRILRCCFCSGCCRRGQGAEHLVLE